ncbi:sporulation peptidase YabG [Mangrovibacillus cuniculi]|uniref:Sporulation peptidase YabG n=1 Tax=Mangrovibacillus cuniculi TaxID=2593652 RepID=A0A7S8CDF9_9BACI|nr:sporulation peptidase YabG [Mangrovibacillus cuniculi]QPC47969.1 sporulation peptidase YabG [Mangrovibacillus cuniculi]
MGIDIHSVVARESYGRDLLFRIIDWRTVQGERYAVLYGEDVRLIADAPIWDLVEISHNDQSRISSPYRSQQEQSFELLQQEVFLLQQQREYEATGGYQESSQNIFHVPGKVLHLDGDASYLRKCQDLYERIGVPVIGIHCSETEMPHRVQGLLEQYRPDILVITGHDAYSKTKGKKSDINAYRHSKYFVETVRNARDKVPHLDQLVIFAGACQSHFESIIHAGANFASSPQRVNIHALDPVYIVAKISFTPFRQRVNLWEILRNTLTGEKGLGGIETLGVLRTGMPYPPMEE